MAPDLHSLAVPASASAAAAARGIDAIASVRRWLDIAPVLWKNSGGRTRELEVFPAQADFASFIWRASVADVDSDGDFSTFDDIDRTIVLLEGAGFKMHIDDTTYDLRDRFAPFAFDGEAAVSVRLHGPATRDFNLMVRRSAAAGEITVFTEHDNVALPRDTVLLHMTQGNGLLTAQDGAQLSLRRGDTVRFHDSATLPELVCEAGSVALAVQIRLHPVRTAHGDGL